MGGSDAIDFLAVLMESEISVGHEVSCDFFKSILSSLHGHEDVHLQDVLSSVELDLIDWALQGVELLDKKAHQFLRVGSWAFDSQTEKSRVREVGVDSGSSVNKVMLLHKVGDSSAVHSLSWAS